MNWKSIVILILVLAALALSFMSYTRANQAAQLALSDIELEEHNTLMTPVFDEEKAAWSYLAIFETSITNQGPTPVTLESMQKIKDDAGFLVMLKGADIVDSAMNYSAFPVTPTIAQVRTDPRLIKSLVAENMDEQAELNITIAPGQTKAVRFGVKMDIYDPEQQPLAQMVLLSMQFNFANGKIRVFRRGIPIAPLS